LKGKSVKRLLDPEKAFTYTDKARQFSYDISNAISEVMRKYDEYDIVDKEHIARAEIEVWCCEWRLTKQIKLRKDAKK